MRERLWSTDSALRRHVKFILVSRHFLFARAQGLALTIALILQTPLIFPAFFIVPPPGGTVSSMQNVGMGGQYLPQKTGTLFPVSLADLDPAGC